MQYRKDRHGEALSILGYGCMRFSRKGNGVDIDKTEQELLAAYRAGVNYFDTAYIYPGSEAALGEILARNGIRDKVRIATKLPQYLVRNRASLDKYFGEELARLQTDHVEYYLMHHLTDIAQWERLKTVGVEDWIAEKKASDATAGAFTEEDRAFLQQVLDIIREKEKVGCTGCRYCMPCPKGVDIPGIFASYNAMYMESKRSGRAQYIQTVALAAEPSFASQCIKCGKCEQHCPQAIPIREKLQEAEKALLPWPLKPALKIARSFLLRKGKKK